MECPYDGPVTPQAVASVTEQLFSLGCHEVSLGDTIGRGTPDKVAAMLDAVLAIAPAHSLAGHYHDTGGRALDNIRVSLEKVCACSMLRSAVLAAVPSRRAPRVMSTR